MHRGVVEKTTQMEKSKFVEPSYDIGDYCKSKPVFTEPLRVSSAETSLSLPTSHCLSKSTTVTQLIDFLIQSGS